MEPGGADRSPQKACRGIKRSAEVPSWLTARPRSMRDSYGVVGDPVFLFKPGPPSSRLLTGGWRGRPVCLPFARETDRSGELFRIPEEDKGADDFRGADDPHGWFFPVGPMGVVGHQILPPELLLLLAKLAKEGISAACEQVPEPARSVLAQCEPRDESGLCLQPALLLCCEQPHRGDHQNVETTDYGTIQNKRRKTRTIELFESTVSRQSGCTGIFLSCGCDRPGSLQCRCYCSIVETFMSSILGDSRFARMTITSSVDGLILTSLWTVSGASFKWFCRQTEPVPEDMRGKKYVKTWNITA